ncbi:hypothetical protein J5N97_015841 [Dioscorea zingiberensis]|uniref:Uncharacterized protein n=1 Tax=Dioscorea zingiberensis TaxID=325984 RepID=A0A9D5HEL9_9LILI|nr:hypothetical protein J5N97_015841 [Dioscorea zingiberensis]
MRTCRRRSRYLRTYFRTPFSMKAGSIGSAMLFGEMEEVISAAGAVKHEDAVDLVKKLFTKLFY